MRDLSFGAIGSKTLRSSNLELDLKLAKRSASFSLTLSHSSSGSAQMGAELDGGSCGTVVHAKDRVGASRREPFL